VSVISSISTKNETAQQFLLNSATPHSLNIRSAITELPHAYGQTHEATSEALGRERMRLKIYAH
jgi:hypothetical protein